MSSKRTWQPKSDKRKRKIGHLARKKNNPKVLKSRRAKGRKKLTLV